MTNREREAATLGFLRPDGRGAVEETFYPWTLTVERWKDEGLPADIADEYLRHFETQRDQVSTYLDTDLSKCTEKIESFFGLDPVKRFFVNLPLSMNGGKLSCEDDWRQLRSQAEKALSLYFTDEIIRERFSCYVEGHRRGDYPVRLALCGFFWIPRTLFGIEEHLFAFYDHPKIMHEINEFVLSAYLDRVGAILELVPADVVYILEDLSGANGPMLSPKQFDEFIGAYYERLVPFLKKKGVRTVLVDTDGDFTKLIPNFVNSGIDGFLPMDVNAGVDIVEVREKYPKLKFIGGFNKLCIAEGEESIDREFERLRPVIRQGGYIPSCDHQVAPSTPLKNYLYYIERLKDAMKECGLANQPAHR